MVPTSELGGAAEVAEALGCHKQQLTKLRKRADFPQPLIVLAASPIWDMRTIRAFKDTWKRRNVALDRGLGTR